MTPDVVVVDRLVKRYGSFTALKEVSLEIGHGRVHRPPRAERLREDDAPAPHRRLRRADSGDDPHRRAAHERRAAEPEAGQHGVPELRAVPAPDRDARTSPSARGGAASPADETRPRGEGGARSRRHGRLRRALSGGAVRRAAAARRAGPRHRQPAATCCCSTSRSERSICKLRKRMQLELKQLHEQPRHHLHVRHPRSGGGAGHGRPHRGHE